MRFIGSLPISFASISSYKSKFPNLNNRSFFHAFLPIAGGTRLSSPNGATKSLKIVLSEILVVARERFELSSEGPKPSMLDHYTTGLPTFRFGARV